ncbi:MAG: phenylacetate-CoA ligase [Desulforhopalus sp.]|jgi:phenylacetate-CoA ligase
MKTRVRTTVDQLVAERLSLSPGFTQSELEQAQMRRLRDTVSYAHKNSSLYKKRFQDLSLHGLVKRADLETLPFLTTADVVSHGHLLHCVSQSEVARIITMYTSGSTGKPKRYSFTANDLAATSEFFLRGMASLISKEDRVLVLMPFETEASVGELLIGALSGGGIHTQGLWPPPKSAATARLITKEQITSVVGLPQHLLALSEAVTLGQLGSMLLCSDYAPDSLRQRIEKNCGCETFLHYGATESGLGGAVECGAHAGLHIRESDLLIEIVDPDTGKQLPDGDMGEVVLTTLGREAMPLIRYRTGDIASLDRTTCSCGGVTARICNIYGRLHGRTLADGSPLYSQSLDDILFQVPGLLDYRATLDHEGVDRLTIDYIANSDDSQIAETIHTLVSDKPEIFRLKEMGLLHVEKINKVECFAPTHTIKRTVLDIRYPR